MEIKNKTEVTMLFFKNAVSSRSLNKRMSVVKKEKDNNHIEFVRTIEIGEDMNIPTCNSTVYKNKVVVTHICLSDTALEILHATIGEYLKKQIP